MAGKMLAGGTKMTTSKTIEIEGREYGVDSETGLPFVSIIVSSLDHDEDWWTLPEGCIEWDRSYPTVDEMDREYMKWHEYYVRVIFGTPEMVCNAVPNCRFVPAA
jgi:hypothetical protein